MAQVGSSVRHNRDTASTAPSSGDWAAQAADTIERAVGNVRDRTTAPAITVARAVVYGTSPHSWGWRPWLATIGAVRLIDNYLPDAVFGEEHLGDVPDHRPGVRDRGRGPVGPPAPDPPDGVDGAEPTTRCHRGHMSIRKVIVIGSGPAGLTAAVYAPAPTSSPWSSRVSPRPRATSPVGSS